MKKLIKSKSFKILSLMVLIIGVIAANLSIFAAAVLKIEAVPNYTDGKIDLDWNVEGGDVDGYSYKVFRKESNGSYQPISSVDFTNELEVVNVLNVYPEMAGIPHVTFTYTDGTTQTLPKSASMKVWMEGGSMVQDGVTTTFEPLGINPLNARQLIRVTPVASSAFNANPAMIWNYDVVMFGTWDTNGSHDDQPNDTAVEELKKFLNAGFGVVAGHDSIGYSYEHGLNKIRDYFAIETGCWGGPGTKTSNYDIDNVWGYSSTTATVVTNDVLTSYPWNLPVGTKLTIPNTHTCANAAKGIVAMQLTDGAQYSDFAAIANYTGTGNPYYYVTRNNNAVMVQTGHSNCQSTEDERKVLANAVFYLKQMTELNYSMDNNVGDSAAPSAVSASNITRNGTSVSMNLSRVDNGTTYEYYVEGVDKTNGTKLTSNTTSATYTTEVKGYSYVVDNNATTDVDTSIDTTSSNLTATIGNGPNTYLHIRAIDNAGNVGPVSHILLHTNIAPEMTLTPDITTWTNKDVVITAKSTDTDGTVVSIKKPDASVVNTATTTYTVSQNGKYSFTATDNSGATVTKELNITWIDKVKPEGQSTGITQPTSSNRYAVINFKATDDASGVAKIVLPDGKEVTSDTAAFNVTTPGTYTFKVVDVAGNEKSFDVPVTIVSDGLEVKFIDQVTNEEIATKQTKTGNIGDAYTTSAETVAGYELVKTPDNKNGNLTMDKITVTYEYRKNSNVTVRYIDSNSGLPIITDIVTKYKEGDTYTTEEKTFDGYKLVGKTNNTSGTVVRDDIGVTYQYKKISTGVDIKYIDQVTGNEIATTEHFYGLENDTYTTTAKTVDGYELVKTPTNKDGKLAVDLITVTYEYRKNSNVIVKYLDENYGTEIIQNVVTKYKEGDTYSTKAKNLDGYQLVGQTNNTNGMVEREDIVVEYKYKKISAGVETKYIDQVTKEEIATPTHQSGLEKDAYTTEAKDVAGYELVLTPNNKEGEMTVELTTVTYEYRLVSKVTTKFIDVNSRTEIVTAVENNYKEGDAYTTEEKILEGYQLVGQSDNTSGTMGRNNIEVIYEYKKISNGIEVVFVDQVTGSPIAASVVKTGLENQEYTTEAKVVEGYELVAIPTNANGRMTVGKITVKYEYRKLSDVVAKYIDVNYNAEITEEVKQTLKEGDLYTTEEKSFEGYKLTSKTDNTSGVMARENIEVIYEYKKISAGVDVKFIDQVTGAEIATKEHKDGLEKDNYTTEAKDINDYELVKTPTNKNGEMTVELITVTYEYRLLSDVTTKHIDANTGKEIVDAVVETYKEGDAYTTIAKDLVGYILTKSPELPNGTMGREDIEVVYEYKMISDGLIVKYIDEITGDLLDMENYTGNENDMIQLEEKSFDKYILTKRPAASEIKLTVEPQEVRFYYKKLIDINVIGIDAITGEEIYRKVQNGVEGEEYTTTPVILPGYEISKTPDNASGIYTREDVDVIYEYKRVSGGVIVTYVDKDTREVLDSQNITGYVGEEYATEKNAYEKYDFVEVVGNPKGKLEVEQIEITYLYSKKTGTVEIVYVDTEGNELLKEEISGKVDEAYSIQMKEIEKYRLVETEGEVDGQFGLEKQIVKFVFEKIKGKITINFVDKDGNILFESVVTEGEIDEEYYYEALEKEGYEIAENAKIEVKYIDGEIIIDVVYEKIEVPEPPATGDINLVLYLVIALGSILTISKVILKKSEN